VLVLISAALSQRTASLGSDTTVDNSKRVLYQAVCGLPLTAAGVGSLCFFGSKETAYQEAACALQE
jgi:hypothetical protein